MYKTSSANQLETQLLTFTTVVLSGSRSNSDFRGFLIQGRTMDNAATGTFVDNGHDQRIICDNVSVYSIPYSAAHTNSLVYSYS